MRVLNPHPTNVENIVSKVFQYISNKMQRYAVHLYLETALHVSGGTSTHHQEHIQLEVPPETCRAVSRYK
jgi:hypothetical protein